MRLEINTEYTLVLNPPHKRAIEEELEELGALPLKLCYGPENEGV